MIDAQLFEDDGILKIIPRTALEVPDFQRLELLIDSHVDKHGKLKGIYINVEKLPRWDDFSAMLEQFEFIKKHLGKVQRVAVVTDSPVASFLPNLMDKFVSANVRHFTFQDSDQALNWVKSTEAAR